MASVMLSGRLVVSWEVVDVVDILGSKISWALPVVSVSDVELMDVVPEVVGIEKDVLAAED